jgi:hypothetical protein
MRPKTLQAQASFKGLSETCKPHKGKEDGLSGIWEIPMTNSQKFNIYPFSQHNKNYASSTNNS